jgi:hypothetical protein
MEDEEIHYLTYYVTESLRGLSLFTIDSHLFPGNHMFRLKYVEIE